MSSNAVQMDVNKVYDEGSRNTYTWRVLSQHDRARETFRRLVCPGRSRVLNFSEPKVIVIPTPIVELQDLESRKVSSENRDTV